MTTTLIISVGGSPEPVLFSLQKHKPRMVWFFCSPQSRDAELPKILTGIGGEWDFQHEVIVEEKFEELGPCYKTLRENIPALMEKFSVSAGEVTVDYTGGTKTMSAALVLAATELFQNFAYVGGGRRDKAGLGVTVSGTERTVLQPNPWTQLAVRELERAGVFWNHGNFDAAAELLKKIFTLTQKPAHETLLLFAQVLAARERFSFNAMRDQLQQLKKRDCPPPLTELRNTLAVIADKRRPPAVLLDEVIDSALRAADRQRYEDAAARLYRAVELHGQIELAKATGGLFANGKCKAENFSKLPLLVKCFISDNFSYAADRQRDCKLALENIYQVLAHCGDQQALAITGDIRENGKKSAWRNMTGNRNQSILAHGTEAVTRERFDQMKSTVSGFLKWNLDQQRRPVPPFDPRWAE